MPFVVLIVDWVIEILIILIVIASLISWFRPDPRNPLVRLLHQVVDPLLHPVRSLLPSSMGLDFSPMVVILILYVLQQLLRSGLT